MKILGAISRILPERLIGPRLLANMPDKLIKDRYVEHGKDFGDAVSYIYMGECIGFEGYLNTWAKYESEYANRGYRTISLDDFISAGGYGKSISHLVGVKRNEDEKPVLHAEIYREKYLGKVHPEIDLNKVMEGEIQHGTYVLPSTKES